MEAIKTEVFAGTIRPGQIRIVREIRTPAAGADDADTVVFSDNRANYDFAPGPSTTRMTVSHVRGTQIDGTDTVLNAERLVFADQTVELAALGTNGPPTGTVDINDMTPEEGSVIQARRAFDDPDGVDEKTLQILWQAETVPGVWTTTADGVTFTPSDAETALRLRAVATFQDGDGVFETVRSRETAPVGNVNDPPSGRPSLSDPTPVEGQVVTALTGSIADLDGLVGVGFRYQWQQKASDPAAPFRDIAGATAASFTPAAEHVGKPLRVVVSFTDNGRRDEATESGWSSQVERANLGVLPPALGVLPGAEVVAPVAVAPVDAPVAAAPPRPAARPSAPAPARLRASGLTARSVIRRGTPIALGVDLPGATRAVRVKVVRLGARGSRKVVGTVHRRVRTGGRHKLRLTERKLRNLKPGRYLVEVRAGTSRGALGPAVTRRLRISA
jgi:hypothetical protein